jgi:dihydroorotase-like cyclic amidohydrolase
MPDQSGSLAALASGDSTVVMEPGTWPVVHTPAAATQAIAAKAAGGEGVRHVCRGISASIACGANAQTPIRLVLRDGATGVGAILWSKKLSAPANSTANVDLTGLAYVGSPNTAMTLEFAAAGVAASEQDVTLSGVTLQR